MSMVFRFRMLSDENDNFVRDYEAMYDMTLLDFHDFILQSLEYEPCMASFFTADDRWEKQREFTSVEMDDGSGDAPAAMESVTLGQVIHPPRPSDLSLRHVRRPCLFSGTYRNLRGREGRFLSA